MESHLANLDELLVAGENANVNKRYHDVVRRPDSSSSSNKVLFKVETKVDIPTFGREVDVKKGEKLVEEIGGLFLYSWCCK